MKMTRRGFSLIELLIVVAIIAALVGVAVPFFQDNLSDAQKTKAKQDLDVIKSAINLHDSQNRPLIGSELLPLKGRYLQETPRDPWGNEYLLDADIGLIISFGADAQAGGVSVDEDIYYFYKPDLAIKRVQYDGTWGTAKSAAEVILTMTKPFTYNSATTVLNTLELLTDLRVQDAGDEGQPISFTTINGTGTDTPAWTADTKLGTAGTNFSSKYDNPANGIMGLINDLPAGDKASGDTQPITPTMALNFNITATDYGIAETCVADGPLTTTIYGPAVDAYWRAPIHTPLYNGENRGVKFEKF